MINVKIVYLPSYPEGCGKLKYARYGDSGLDLRAAIDEDWTLSPHTSFLVPTGVKVALPYEYEIQIRPRSGMAYKFGITVLNSPGTIDSCYRNEIGVILINHSHDEFCIHRGDRIAQAVLKKVEMMYLVEVDELDVTDRNLGGFGSTGTK